MPWFLPGPTARVCPLRKRSVACCKRAERSLMRAWWSASCRWRAPRCLPCLPQLGPPSRLLYNLPPIRPTDTAVPSWNSPELAPRLPNTFPDSPRLRIMRPSFCVTGRVSMKMRNIGLCLAVAIIAALAVPVAAVPPDETLAFVHATVIDATGSPAQPDLTVIIADRRIVEIGTSASVRVPKNARVVDARDKFLIPGLWDMHVHEIFGDWIPEDEKVTPLLFVANGVTGVRDMGGDLGPLKKWRSRIASGDMLGPRMIIAGPMLDGPVPAFPSSAPVKDAADGRRIVQELKADGVDFIKIQSLVPRDGYFAAADEAKKQGIVFAGHVPDAVRAAEASSAGQKSIEHLTGVFEGCSSVEAELMSKPRGPGRGRFLSTYDPAKAKALIALFLKNRTW